MPTRLAPEKVTAHGVFYHASMREFDHCMHADLRPTRVWGYAAQYPGPTIEAQQGVPVQVHWENNLPTSHLLPVDFTLHGAMPPAPAVRAVPHLHGSRTESMYDGMPENWFLPGASARYRYRNEQRAATLWYHDHADGLTRLNVYAGLAGFYLLRDAEEARLNLPSGDYEIPLMLQDRTLGEDGKLLYVPTDEAGQPLPPGVWGPECYGELPVINGVIYPYLEVEPRAYRFRLLNAANARFFNLFLNAAGPGSPFPVLKEFQQIGTDGGLLGQPAALSRLLLAPGERADLIVDFRGLDGKEVILSNDAPAPYPGWDAQTSTHAALTELMQFRVTRPLRPGAPAFSMPSLPPLEKLREADVKVTRDLVITAEMDSTGKGMSMLLDGKPYNAPVTEIARLGSVEKWRFINPTDDSHPIHLHLVHFQILNRQGFDTKGYSRGQVQLVGIVRPPETNEAGWKDTAVVHPGEVLTLLIRFDGFPGRYMYHCHVLEHGDNDMMRPFLVIAPKAEQPA